MLDKWLLKDIQDHLTDKKRCVIIDEQRQIEFLLPLIKEKGYKIFVANDTLAELKIKYEIEKLHKNDKVVIYTTSAIDKLSFIREYCETESHFQITFLNRYITAKVNNELKLTLNLQPEELTAAAKQSIGKDKSYWKNLSANGITGLFGNFEEVVISFISDPQSFNTNNDESVKNIFYELISAHLKIPNINKPASTLASEIVQKIFENIYSNMEDVFFTKLFEKWCNSKKDFPLLLKKSSEFHLPERVDVWNIMPNHPFKKIDDEWIKLISKNINDPAWLNSKSILFKERANSSIAKEIGVNYWQAVVILVSFDVKSINKINSLDDAVKFYTTEFYKIDSAIRVIYTEFLNNKSLLKPIQEYYENILNTFLEKWFNHFTYYKENQSGLLESLINSNQPNTAIIVGDGVNFEIARSLYLSLQNEFVCSDNFIFADYPSETENNMSRLYLSKDEIENEQSKRQLKLSAITKKNINFMYIDDINYSSLYDYLIVISKDIDSLGEKIQQKALKYFDQIKEELSDKIKFLLSIGYKKVYLISDHGFVLTGILEESDKISVSLPDKNINKNERYIWLENELKDVPNNLVQLDKSYKTYKYILFSKSIRPFKTVGNYGYSHGGITPQELIVPFFSFAKNKSDEFGLNINIINKEELLEVVGNSFVVKLKSEDESDLMKANVRKVILVFFKDGKQFYEGDIFEIKISSVISKEFSLSSNKEFDMILLDSNTRETLDRAIVKQKQIRNINL